MKEYFSKETIEIYKYFKEQTGSDHIATPVSIEALLNVCKNDNPKNILEIGGGVGTLTYMLAKYSNANIDVYEDHDFCKKKLAENMKNFKGRYALIDDYKLPTPRKNYDLVIIDGPIDKGKDFSKEEVVYNIIHDLSTVNKIYIEGNRYTQRFAAINALKGDYAYRVIRHTNVNSNLGAFKGGVEINCYRTNSILKNLLSYYFWKSKESIHYIILKSKKRIAKTKSFLVHLLKLFMRRI